MKPLLGPFELHLPIGRGGMGEVWRGVHRSSGAPVAIKLLTGASGQHPFFLAAFRNEVRAMAGLNHPYIAMLLDHGEVSDEEAAASGQMLQPGAPYLAMELAEGGGLAGWCGRLPWRDVREILVCLLDALAHAHARGVIHRDIKPGNVLLGDPHGPRPGVKLSDFGLAQMIRDTVGAKPLPGGTPHFMAPEQRARRRSEQGPATDLYALGRLALALLWGSPTPSARDLARGPSVPAALYGWLARLLRADADERFACAADALLALDELDEQGAWAGPPSQLQQLGVSGDTFVLTRPFDATTPEPEGGSPGSSDAFITQLAAESDTPWSEVIGLAPGARGSFSSPDPGAGGDASPEPPPWERAQPARTRAPPVAADWRRRSPPTTPPRMVDAGLGLFGLRPPPMVGRERERDALWESLRQVSQLRRPVAVVLEGPAGSGATRLAEWLCERAHELGAANAWTASHSPQGGPVDGLGPALARAWSASGLSRLEVLALAQRSLARRGASDPEEALAVTELMHPSSLRDVAQGGRAIRFSGPAERHAQLKLLLSRLTLDRPHILVIDNAQWAADALAFAERLLHDEGDSPLPVLIVIAVAHEELTQRSAESDALRRIRAAPDARVLDLRPLDAERHGQFVRGLLGLEGALSALVEERTAGNPMFAVQLIGDWIFRGLLEPGPEGFRLKPGANVGLPSHLLEVWDAHVQAILAGRPESDGQALEAAAALGLDVDGEEWRLLCEELGLSPPLSLVESMLERRLARAPADPEAAWSFAHGMLREAIELRTRESRRCQTLHRAAAAMLRRQLGFDLDQPRPSALSPADALIIERLGRHSLKALDFEEALRALALSVRVRLGSGDYAEAEALMGEHARALEALALPEKDPARLEASLLRGRVARLRGRSEDARQLQTQVAADCPARATRLHAEALGELGALAWARGQPAHAVELSRQATRKAELAGDPALLGQQRMVLAAMLRRRGELREADALYRSAVLDYLGADDQLGEAYCLHGLGDIARLEGRTLEARQHFELALAGFERAGARRGLADSHNALGEVARLEGKLAEAEVHYNASLARLEAIGSQQSIAPACNLGLTLLEGGRYPEAGKRLSAVLTRVERHGPRIYLGNLRAYLLPCYAAAGEWSRFDLNLTAAQQLLAESQQVELDVARMAEQAARLAEERGQPARACAALQLAEAQWRALAQPARADEAQRRIEALTEA